MPWATDTPTGMRLFARDSWKALPERGRGQTWWQIGRYGLRVLSHRPGRWTLVTMSTRDRQEDAWLRRNSLDGLVFPTRTAAVRAVRCTLAADPLPCLPAPDMPRPAGKDVWVSEGGHWQARRVAHRAYRIVAVSEQAKPYELTSVYENTPLVLVRRLLDDVERQVVMCRSCEEENLDRYAPCCDRPDPVMPDPVPLG